MFDGFRWEHFIRTKLPLLNQFDILLSCHHNKNSDIISLESVILPFQTPFWLEEKSWFVTCDYVIGYSRTRLYTKSICVDRSETNNKCQVTSMDSTCRLILDSEHPIEVCIQYDGSYSYERFC
jgi:hypothetical protein